MTITAEVRESLGREYTICSKAISFYKKQVKELEKKYGTDTQTFLRKFEAGELGDERAFFDWYAFHNLLSDWVKTKNALQPFVK